MRMVVMVMERMRVKMKAMKMVMMKREKNRTVEGDMTSATELRYAGFLWKVLNQGQDLLVEYFSKGWGPR